MKVDVQYTSMIQQTNHTQKQHNRHLEVKI